MQSVSDFVPLNARVLIDYENGKQVKFSYPCEKDNVFSKRLDRVFMTFFSIWGFYTVVVFFVFLFFSFGLMIMSSGGFSIPMQFHYLLDMEWLVGFFFFLLFSIIIPLSISFYITLDYKKFSKIFPKLNYSFYNFLKKEKLRTRVTELTEPFFEIPFFENIYLNYRCSGEFADFLKRVEVTEHDFKIVRKVHGKEVLEPQDWCWRARFYFSQTPKTGELVADFF